jgi:hypothetical protein
MSKSECKEENMMVQIKSREMAAWCEEPRKGKIPPKNLLLKYISVVLLIK